MENTEAEAVASQTSQKKGRYWGYVFGVAFMVIATIVILWWLFRQPSQGTIMVMPAEEKTTQSDPVQRTRYQGKYVTFTYPYDYQRREEVEAVKHPLLERVYLSRADVEGRKIALTLQDNTGYAFEEYSSLRIRQNDPAVYSREKIERNGLNAVVFMKTTSVFEASAFFHRGNRVVGIVVSSPTTQNGLREELVSLLDSFAWTEE